MGQTGLHILVLSNVLAVIIINEWKIIYLPINAKGWEDKKQTDPDFRPNIQKGIFTILAICHD